MGVPPASLLRTAAPCLFVAECFLPPPPFLLPVRHQPCGDALLSVLPDACACCHARSLILLRPPFFLSFFFFFFFLPPSFFLFLMPPLPRFPSFSARLSSHSNAPPSSAMRAWCRFTGGSSQEVRPRQRQEGSGAPCHDRCGAQVQRVRAR